MERGGAELWAPILVLYVYPCSRQNLVEENVSFNLEVRKIIAIRTASSFKMTGSLKIFKYIDG